MERALKDYLARLDVHQGANKVMSTRAANIVLKPFNIGIVRDGAKVNHDIVPLQSEVDIHLPIGLKADYILTGSIGSSKNMLEVPCKVQETAANPAPGKSHRSRYGHFH